MQLLQLPQRTFDGYDPLRYEDIFYDQIRENYAAATLSHTGNIHLFVLNNEN